MTKKKGKLKVMHLEPKHAQEKTSEQSTGQKPDPDLERAYNALVKLGGRATSPELVKELGFTGESARDKVRRLMEKLHKDGRIHRRHDAHAYVFTTLDDTEPPKTETGKPQEVAA